MYWPADSGTTDGEYTSEPFQNETNRSENRVEVQVAGLTRREALTACVATAVGAAALPLVSGQESTAAETAQPAVDSGTQPRSYGEYSGERLNRVAFPLGGMGAGMICLEGTGALSHFSLRNAPDVFNEPCTFAAISLKGRRRWRACWKARCQAGSCSASRAPATGLRALRSGCRGFAKPAFARDSPLPRSRCTIRTFRWRSRSAAGVPSSPAMRMPPVCRSRRWSTASPTDPLPKFRPCSPGMR